MRPTVRLQTRDGASHALSPGDIIGRLRGAALHIDDARISEAHALVSLRGEELKLLSLRGVFAVDQKPVSEVVLEPGLELLLAPGVPLLVEDVLLPDTVLALEGDGLPRTVLSGVCSLVVDPRPGLVAKYVEGAAAHLWSTGDGWRLRRGNAAPLPVEAGTEWGIGERRFRIVAMRLSHAGQTPTQLGGGVSRPLRIVARYDTAHIHQVGEPPLQLTGVSARILSVLVSVGAPLGWHALAAEVWPGEDDRMYLRRKFDVSLARLRKKLRDGRVRGDLVQADGSGHFELLLGSEDQLIDES